MAFAWAPAERGLQGIQNKSTLLTTHNYIILGGGLKESFIASLVQSSEMSADILQQLWRTIYDMHPKNLKSIKKLNRSNGGANQSYWLQQLQFIPKK